MAQTRDNHFSPSSPHSSSGGADSFKGTPDTRFSNYSPADGSAKSTKLLKGIAHSALATPPVRHPVSGYRGPVSQLDRDPFVTPGQATRLSPTASAFQPFSEPSLATPSSAACPVASALSTELGLSRLLDLSSPSVSANQVEHWLKELDDQGVQFHGQRFVKGVAGHVYVQFTDIRDACAVHASCRISPKDWKLDFVNPSKVQKDDMPQHGSGAPQSGQVLIFAVVQQGASVDGNQATDTVKNLLHPHGQLFAFTRLSTFSDGSFRAIVEFCNTSAALAAITSCTNNPIIDGMHVVLSLHNPDAISPHDLTGAFQSLSFVNGAEELDRQRAAAGLLAHRPQTASIHYPTYAMLPMMIRAPYAPGMSYMMDQYPSTVQASPMTPMSPSYTSLGPLYQTPPSPALTAQNNQSPSRPMSGYNRPDARRQNATRISRSPHHNAAGHHNHVDIQRIREGIDVRTTIMLRNIPNKVDQAMLKRIVDESSWGKYDFMYLRIDFANDCNVGYAFINFVDPLDIIDFVEARGNQRWNCFKSDKVAEISYATIQGKDCLVQKFRNSSVMLEAPHYRPKLYFTSNGPMPELAGQEEPFPEPDNQSKMKRSCENAEHVGLFTPNAGQHFRDEQRRRRSQYDRGTRLAALEEYNYEADYDTSAHHRPLYDTATQ